MRRFVMSVVLILGLLVLGVRAVSADQAGAEPTVPHVVKAGETLWTIARKVDPEGDRRAVVQYLIELNDLSSGAVSVGQPLLLPAR